MALTPETNDAFVREVDEELRRDKTEDFVRRHGRSLVVAVVLLLVAAGAYLWWQSQRAEQAGQEAEALIQSYSDVSGAANEAAGRKTLDTLAKSSRDGYSASARLTLAALTLQKGDVAKAAAAYGAIAEDTGIAQPFRDLALIRQTAAEYDALPPGTVAARLQGLAVPGNPWFGSAGEMVAIADLKAGKRAAAGAMFAALAKDSGVPETIRSRAVQMAGILGVDAVAQSTAPGATETTSK